MFHRNPSTSLLKAAKKGKLPSVERLLSEGAPVNASNEWGETALILAAQGGHTEVVRLLINKGAALDTHDNSGKTALMHAAKEGRAETAALLAVRGADLDTGDKYGNTALMWAVLCRHPGTVEVLLDNGANIDKRNKYFHTAMDLAKKNRQMQIIGLLSDARKNPKPKPRLFRDSDRWTKLGPMTIAHANVDEETQIKLTETFNFASRERTVTRENLTTRAKTTEPPESFDVLDKSILWNAFHHFTNQGGKVDQNFVFGKPKPPSPK